jgi:hypothetical protein
VSSGTDDSETLLSDDATAATLLSETDESDTDDSETLLSDESFRLTFESLLLEGAPPALSTDAGTSATGTLSSPAPMRLVLALRARSLNTGPVGVAVGVLVAVDVAVGVGVLVAVLVNVAVGVAVAVFVDVAVNVALGVLVAGGVAVAVRVGAGVDVLQRWCSSQPSARTPSMPPACSPATIATDAMRQSARSAPSSVRPSVRVIVMPPTSR